MSKNTPENIRFDISPSQRVLTIFDILHFLALWACWFNSLDLEYKLIFSVAVVLVWCSQRRRFPASPIHLSYTSGLLWEISYDGNIYLPVTILETTVITNTAVFLHYTVNHCSRRNLLISKDSLSDDAYRRLIVKLKLSGYSQR